jgi:hypothetical protein
MRRTCVLLLAVVVLLGLSAPSQATLREKHKRCKHRFDCGPVDWQWGLPPGNGHYWAFNPCLKPAADYSPPISPYYRGPYLRTIDVPLE